MPSRLRQQQISRRETQCFLALLEGSFFFQQHSFPAAPAGQQAASDGPHCPHTVGLQSWKNRPPLSWRIRGLVFLPLSNWAPYWREEESLVQNRPMVAKEGSPAAPKGLDKHWEAGHRRLPSWLSPPLAAPGERSRCQRRSLGHPAPGWAVSAWRVGELSTGSLRRRRLPRPGQTERAHAWLSGARRLATPVFAF